MTAITEQAHSNLVESAAELAKMTRDAVAQIGARNVSLCKFVDAVLPILTPDQCRTIIPYFRSGIEDAKALTVGTAVPSEYQVELDEQTNILLAALEIRSGW